MEEEAEFVPVNWKQVKQDRFEYFKINIECSTKYGIKMRLSHEWLRGESNLIHLIGWDRNMKKPMFLWRSTEIISSMSELWKTVRADFLEGGIGDQVRENVKQGWEEYMKQKCDPWSQFELFVRDKGAVEWKWKSFNDPSLFPPEMRSNGTIVSEDPKQHIFVPYVIDLKEKHRKMAALLTKSKNERREGMAEMAMQVSTEQTASENAVRESNGEDEELKSQVRVMKGALASAVAQRVLYCCDLAMLFELIPILNSMIQKKRDEKKAKEQDKPPKKKRRSKKNEEQTFRRQLFGFKEDDKLMVDLPTLLAAWTTKEFVSLAIGEEISDACEMLLRRNKLLMFELIMKTKEIWEEMEQVDSYHRQMMQDKSMVIANQQQESMDEKSVE
jgi:hypothetical protein